MRAIGVQEGMPRKCQEATHQLGDYIHLCVKIAPMYLEVAQGVQFLHDSVQAARSQK